MKYADVETFCKRIICKLSSSIDTKNDKIPRYSSDKIKLFHGGCHHCIQQLIHGLKKCRKCQYYHKNWGMPSKKLTTSDLLRKHIKLYATIKGFNLDIDSDILFDWGCRDCHIMESKDLKECVNCRLFEDNDKLPILNHNEFERRIKRKIELEKEQFKQDCKRYNTKRKQVYTGTFKLTIDFED